MRKTIPASQPFATYRPRIRKVCLKRWVALAALVVVVFDGGCRKSTSTEGVPSYLGSDFMLSNAPVQVGHAIKLSDLSESEIHFGIAPKRGPGVTYQDGIILMEHGDKAIQSFASDGVSWTLDASAPQVSDSNTIRPVSEPVLKEIAQAMADRPNWKLTVTGHTDNIGGHTYNLELSQRRADAVKKALVDRYHINPNRLSTSGDGDSAPLDTNDTLEGRARNRRVELTLD